MIYFNI